MKGLTTVFKRYFAFGVLILILFFLLWLKLISKDIPQENFPQPTISLIPEIIKTKTPVISQNLSVQSGGKINYNYIGDPFNPPREVRIYYPKNNFLTTIEDTKLLTSIFAFSTPPTVTDTNSEGNKFYLWSENNKVLSIGGSPLIIHFNDYNFLKDNPNPVVFNKSSLVKKTKSILEQLEVNVVDYNNPYFVYYKTEIPIDSDPDQNQVELIEVENENEASYIGVGLTFSLGGFPVFTDNSSKFPAYFIFDSTENLFELTARIVKISDTVESLKVKPFEEMLTELNSKAIVFDALAKENLNQYEPPLYNLDNLSLDKVNISYYLPLTGVSSIYPFYYFTGKGVDKNSGNMVNVTVLVPVN